MRKIICSSFSKVMLQYNETHEERIKKICSPLKRCFDITYFGYCRIFNDGRYILISNCPAWREAAFFYDFFFRTEFCRTMPQYFSKYKPLKLIFSDNIIDEAFEFLKYKNAYNLFNIVQENAGSLEICFFANDHDSPLIKDFYRSYSDSLADFIIYFKKIGRELIDPTDISRQGILPFIKKTYPKIETIFKNTTTWEEKIVTFNALLNSNVEEEIHEIGKRNLLSSRELQCLSHSSTGLTAKEIARTLGIGYRTVQTHLDNVRLKTGCQTKRELTHWFEDKFYHFLTI